MEENPEIQKQVLIDIVQTRMPYGKYKGKLLCDIPVSYLEWMAKTGFPKNKIGNQLSTVFEIKTNGLSEIIDKLKRMYPAPNA